MDNQLDKLPDDVPSPRGRGEYVDETFEHRVTSRIARALPEWIVESQDTTGGRLDFDVVAISPSGYMFPIEVDGSGGRLDVSSVVDFGSAVEDRVEAAPRLLKQLQMDWIRPWETPAVDAALVQEITHLPLVPKQPSQEENSIEETLGYTVPHVVKPILLTTREPSPASSQYAAEFFIDIVTAPDADVSPAHLVKGALTQQDQLSDALVERLQEWEGEIQKNEMLMAGSGSDLNQPDDGVTILPPAEEKWAFGLEAEGPKRWYDLRDILDTTD